MHWTPYLRRFKTPRALYSSVPDDMSGNISATALGHLRLKTSVAPVHVNKSRNSLQLSSVVALSATFSIRLSHRHIVRSHSATAPRPGTYHCRAADTHQGAIQAARPTLQKGD